MGGLYWMYDLATQADYAEPQPGAELLTCLAQYRTSTQMTHHCALELPHDEHRCPCGIRWKT